MYKPCKNMTLIELMQSYQELNTRIANDERQPPLERERARLVLKAIAKYLAEKMN